MRALLALSALAAAAAARPNFVLILTDDQDTLLNGMVDMPAAQAALVRGGRTFASGYTVDPICCPSRTALISGRYPHNLEEEETSVGWCGDLAKTGGDNRTFIAALHDAGYATALHGKYHNEPPTRYIPRGYDDFFVLLDECNYVNNTWVLNDGPGGRPRQAVVPGYMTSNIGNRSLAWLASAASNASASGGAPFLLYIAPHAPHMPTSPAPWYADAPLPGGERAPRTPAYNASGAGSKQWVIGELAPLDGAMAAHIDSIYALRHRALLSVDDIVAGVVETLRAAGALQDTYIVYTSDHGYNLGTFRLSVEKFHFLENDIRVPFYVAGPGIAPGSASPALVSQLDIGQTLLELAGLPALPGDGRSFAAELRAPDGALAAAAAAPRDRLVIEYYGGGYVVRGPCSAGCGVCAEDALNQLVDAPSNTYSALRIHNATHDLMYGEFRPRDAPAAHASTNWTEFYDLAADPFQLVNLAVGGRAPPALLAQLSAELFDLATCIGEQCP